MSKCHYAKTSIFLYMKRRKFINATSTLAAATIPLGCAATSKALATTNQAEESEKELYEIRTYEIAWGGNVKMLMSYLQEALKPALMRAGSTGFMLFEEVGNTTPKRVRAFISYPNSATYVKAQSLQSDDLFVTATKDYASFDKPIYNRYSSSLMLAFDGLPKMMAPVDDASVYELRIYEGYNEDAVRRKIKMFNDEEIPLFLKVGLNPVFFGEMISGPYRPCLVYMINFKDMEAHGVAWKKFIDSPEWNEMKVKPMYANTLSNIRNYFLKPV